MEQEKRQKDIWDYLGMASVPVVLVAAGWIVLRNPEQSNLEERLQKAKRPKVQATERPRHKPQAPAKIDYRPGDGDEIFQWELEFEEGLESEVHSSDIESLGEKAKKLRPELERKVYALFEAKQYTVLERWDSGMTFGHFSIDGMRYMFTSEKNGTILLQDEAGNVYQPLLPQKK